MVTIQGKGVSAGIGIGPLCFHRRPGMEVTTGTAADTDAQWLRFRRARTEAVEQLGVLAEKARAEAGDQAALLFETHQLLAEDLDFEETVEGLIREQRYSAETAVSEAGDRFCRLFSDLEDGYMRERAADVRDVSDRILRNLCGGEPGTFDFPEPVLLAAEDLAPSETIRMDKKRILGFVTAFGSGSGHTAILARTMGIPAVVGLGDGLDPAWEGQLAVVDGGTGVVIVGPTREILEVYTSRQKADWKKRASLETLKGQENMTRDGKQIRVSCNAGTPEDVDAVRANDGEGIGLFRSEFLFLNRSTYPTEQEQFEAYKTVLSRMGDQEVIIRTCDIGADKTADYFALPREENPAMGMCGLRVSLSRPEVFRTQLRALYRASAFGNLGILLPMVTSVWEVREAKRLIERVKQELAEEGISYCDHVRLGLMIETPAAAILSDRLAREVDFFSCGTNDLTQYTLVCDRQNNNLGRFYDPHHPAVLRLLKLVADNAHRNGIPVRICGELAADLDMTEVFLAIGVDGLSVVPGAVLPLREKIRNIDTSESASGILAALEDGEI